MKVFVLTETDSTAPTWCYNECFTDEERDTERLKELYHENITERQELVVKAELNDKNAYGEMVDGIIIAWNIKEVEIN